MRFFRSKAGRLAVDYAVIVSMALLMALNYEIFILPNAFAPAGLNGLATMIQYLFHFSVGYVSLIINIPLAVACALFVNRRYAVRTMVFTLVFSGALLLLQNAADMSRFIYHTDDGRSTLLAPVVSGTVNGFIYGMVIRHGSSTGGTDFIGEFVHKRDPSLKVEMITAHPEEVTEAVINELHHSTTILRAEGGFSHREKTMLVCVINYHQIARMESIISRFPDTFACVSAVNETLGNFRHVKRR